MQIVHLSEKDLMQILELDKLAFQNYDIRPLTKKEISTFLNNGFILGIKENGKLISNIQVMTKNKNWFIEGVATLPEKQGRGLANNLINEVLKIAKEKKIRKINATVKPDNAKSRALFEKNGFAEVDFLKDYYGKGKDRILVSTTLK
ncbi:MAG TPA: GNAT family N-acetyltransferase [archaeon]|nr:GNAT family N-acetyltransferase [archaeon]